MVAKASAPKLIVGQLGSTEAGGFLLAAASRGMVKRQPSHVTPGRPHVYHPTRSVCDR